MTKKQKMMRCNWALLVLGILTLISSLQLEITADGDITNVWIHIVVALSFLILVAYHLYLHFGLKAWISKLKKLKSQVTRIIFAVFIITLVSGFISMVPWIITYSHTTWGGIHGKFGFIFLIFCIGHTIKRFRFMRPPKK